MQLFHRSYFKFFLITFCFSFSFATGAQTSTLSAGCDVYMDRSPLNRTSGNGEEQVINGVYQAVAQQYNSIVGQIKSVVFWGRVNPLPGMPSNTLKVVIYNANLGLPGTILGSQNIVVDSSSTNYMVTATFSSPVNVSGNIIISIEPLSSTNDNYFIQRNVSPDGQNLNLIKLKQANQWFKNLAAGDPAFDFDFMILPVKAVTVTAGFNSSPSGNTTNFTNTSTNASSYLWDFGDGDTSTATSPSHNYASTNTYNVKLKAYGSGPSTCVDSVTNAVPVVITGINQYDAPQKNNLIIVSNLVHDKLIIESSENTSITIVDMLGTSVGKYDLKDNQYQAINVESLQYGIYFIRSANAKPVRFVKLY